MVYWREDGNIVGALALRLHQECETDGLRVL